MSLHEQLEKYTTTDYEQWHGDWELIQGRPVAMTPSPGFLHQRVRLQIARRLDEQLEECPQCTYFPQMPAGTGRWTMWITEHGSLQSGNVQEFLTFQGFGPDCGDQQPRYNGFSSGYASISLTHLECLV
ncbi:MAG: hypothetical protein ACLFPB_05965 [Desulfovermiculus sp.]